MFVTIVSCSTIPSFGPSAKAFEPYSVGGDDSLKIVKLGYENASSLQSWESSGFGKLKGDGVVGYDKLSIGEKLKVNVWEVNDAGLFSGGGKRQSEFDVAVNENGDVFFPFIGKVPAQGYTVEQLRSNVTGRLKQVVKDPQVQITRSVDNLHYVTVNGVVASPGRVVIPRKGSRVLDVIAESGGSKVKMHNAFVVLVRGGKKYKSALTKIQQTPSQNVKLQGGDRIIVEERVRSFLAFGAFSKQQKVEMDKTSFKLSDAIAKAGGLDDDRAGVKNVYLFRFEKKSKLRELGVSLPSVSYPQGLPVVYHLNLQNPHALFVAQSVSMKDGDLVYVAGASASEFKKFIDNIIGPFLVSQGAVKRF